MQIRDVRTDPSWLVYVCVKRRNRFESNLQQLMHVKCAKVACTAIARLRTHWLDIFCHARSATGFKFEVTALLTKYFVARSGSVS